MRSAAPLSLSLAVRFRASNQLSCIGNLDEVYYSTLSDYAIVPNRQTATRNDLIEVGQALEQYGT